MQLEKAPAAFGQRKLPSLADIRHLMDYVVYRLTRGNVGPWGLSRYRARPVRELGRVGHRDAAPRCRRDPGPAPGSGAGRCRVGEGSALVTVTHYTAQGTAETAGASTDLVLARRDGELHEFRRDPAAPDRLIPGPRDAKDVRDTLDDLLAGDVRAA